MFYSDDIAVVGAGCFFPDSPDADAFWKNVLAGKPALRPVPEARWPESLYGGEGEDQTYSGLGSFIEAPQLDALCARFGLAFKETNRFELYTLEATRQALETLPPELLKGEVAVTLGCLGADEQYSIYKFLLEEPRLREHAAGNPAALKLLDETVARLRGDLSSPLGLVLATAVFEKLTKVFRFKGQGCLVDAACASSLAALDVAMKRLRSRECDVALAGGVESELPPEQFVLFSKLGLMSRGQSLPLDDRTDGITQGEGAAVFCLLRLADARARGLTPWAVLTGCGGSSNGKGSSLFSPTAEGQRLALERAYGDRKPERLDYLECHATGTRVGDATEIETVDGFFSGATPPIPMGSVKALIGHTKGAAGAAGLMKALLAIRHRTAPPSPYFRSYVDGKKPAHVYVNPEPVPIRSELPRLGVSSAGFGGTNYHVACAAFDPSAKITERPPPELGPVAVLAAAHVPVEGSRECLADYGFKIPPKNLEAIDQRQLLTLMAVAEALDRAGLDPAALPHERVSVLSSASLGLDAWLPKRVRHFELARGNPDPQALAWLLKHRERYPRLSEDAGPGTLNNVIAGRVANVFDFQGTNFHLDADLASFACALGVARLELWHRACDVVVVVGVEDTVDDSIPDVTKGGVHALIVCRPETAESLGRAPLFLVERVAFAA